MSLYEELLAKFGSREDCYCLSYYGINVDINELFNSTDACRKFIALHFSKGQKMAVMRMPWEAEYATHGKHEHTVYLYLLGLYLQDLLVDRLESKMVGAIGGLGNWFEFKYIWFLTCLTHDLASCIEEGIDANDSVSSGTLEFYLGKFDILYTPYNYCPLNSHGLRPRFSENQVKNYFQYRLSQGKIDHGILAGYYMFDRLYKTFLQETAGHDWKMNSKCVKEEGLYWKQEMPEVFAYIADAIISHNLWVAEEKNIAIYKHFGLDPLIPDSSKATHPEKLYLEQYPLHFFLGLLDTLEPSKRFDEEKAQEVYDFICIKQDGSHIRISRRACSNKEDNKMKSGWERWENSLLHLGDWLGVRISKSASAVTIDVDYHTI